ncbi:hypothetical protein [Crucivirus-419]|nr:hypothetical protein [Crucivirus-419]
MGAQPPYKEIYYWSVLRSRCISHVYSPLCSSSSSIAASYDARRLAWRCCSCSDIGSCGSAMSGWNCSWRGAPDERRARPAGIFWILCQELVVSTLCSLSDKLSSAWSRVIAGAGRRSRFDSSLTARRTSVSLMTSSGSIRRKRYDSKNSSIAWSCTSSHSALTMSPKNCSKY